MIGRRWGAFRIGLRRLHAADDIARIVAARAGVADLQVIALRLQSLLQHIGDRAPGAQLAGGGNDRLLRRKAKLLRGRWPSSDGKRQDHGGAEQRYQRSAIANVHLSLLARSTKNLGASRWPEWRMVRSRMCRRKQNTCAPEPASSFDDDEAMHRNAERRASRTHSPLTPAALMIG